MIAYVNVETFLSFLSWEKHEFRFSVVNWKLIAGPALKGAWPTTSESWPPLLLTIYITLSQKYHLIFILKRKSITFTFLRIVYVFNVKSSWSMLNNKFRYFCGKAFIHSCKFATFTHLKHGEELASVNLTNDTIYSSPCRWSTDGSLF